MSSEAPYTFCKASDDAETSLRGGQREQQEGSWGSGDAGRGAGSLPPAGNLTLGKKHLSISHVQTNPRPEKPEEKRNAFVLYKDELVLLRRGSLRHERLSMP